MAERRTNNHTTDITHQTEPGDLPAFLTVEEVQRFLRIGRSSAYALARSRGVKFGGNLRIPREAVTSAA